VILLHRQLHRQRRHRPGARPASHLSLARRHRCWRIPLQHPDCSRPARHRSVRLPPRRRSVRGRPWRTARRPRRRGPGGT